MGYVAVLQHEVISGQSRPKAMTKKRPPRATVSVLLLLRRLLHLCHCETYPASLRYERLSKLNATYLGEGFASIFLPSLDRQRIVCTDILNTGL